MEALKSCPFCGGEPTEVVRKGKDGWRDRYAVLCDYEHGGCGAESGWYHYRNEAVEAWNRRSTSKGTSEQIATNFSNITRSPEKLAEFILQQIGDAMCFGMNRILQHRCLSVKDWEAWLKQEAE